jgi:hypothetical protein
MSDCRPSIPLDSANDSSTSMHPAEDLSTPRCPEAKDVKAVSLGMRTASIELGHDDGTTSDTSQ